MRSVLGVRSDPGLVGFGLGVVCCCGLIGLWIWRFLV